MNSLEAYQLFLGIRNHFFVASYDYFKYGPVPCKAETFEKKHFVEKHRYERLAKKFSTKEELENFLVANFVSSNKKVWIGDLFGGTADEKYKTWMGRTQSAQYNTISQIKRLVEETGDFNSLFVTPGPGQHPEIIKAHLREDISIETFVLLEMCCHFFKKLDKDLDDDRTWFMLKNKSNKYTPFVKRLNTDVQKLAISIRVAVEELGVISNGEKSDTTRIRNGCPNEELL